MLYNARDKVTKLFYDYGDGIKILTAKKIFERITIALAQAKAGNTSENLLNETVKKIHFMYWANKIIKKVYNNLMNLIQVIQKQ